VASGLYPRAVIAGIAAAAKEHPTAAALMSSIETYTQGMHDRAPTDPVRCPDVRRDVRPNPCAGSVVGDVPLPEHYLIGGVCASCWSRPDAKQRIQAALASGLGVRMRVIDIGAAGHA
jgi:hypothetical protein